MRYYADHKDMQSEPTDDLGWGKVPGSDEPKALLDYTATWRENSDQTATIEILCNLEAALRVAIGYPEAAPRREGSEMDNTPTLIDRAKVLEAIDMRCDAGSLVALREYIAAIPGVFPTEVQAAVLGMPEADAALQNFARALAAAQVDTPPEVKRLIDEKFWDLVDSSGDLEFATVGKGLSEAMKALPAPDIAALVAEAREYALKATPGPCQFGYLGADGEPYTDPQRIKEAMGTMIDLAVEHGDSVRGCFLVTAGDADDPVTVAITGNGPTSEANAQFFAGARECVLKLAAALTAQAARLAEANERADERINALEVHLSESQKECREWEEQAGLEEDAKLAALDEIDTLAARLAEVERELDDWKAEAIKQEDEKLAALDELDAAITRAEQAEAAMAELEPVEYIRETGEHPTLTTHACCLADDVEAIAIRRVKGGAA